MNAMGRHHAQVGTCFMETNMQHNEMMCKEMSTNTQCENENSAFLMAHFRQLTFDQLICFYTESYW